VPKSDEDEEIEGVDGENPENGTENDNSEA
jgi:hypothetical protein